jgi:hypothetical protein
MKGRVAMIMATSMAALLGMQPTAAMQQSGPSVTQAKKSGLASDVQRSAVMRAFLGGGSIWTRSQGRRSRPGWTVAHVKRLARKRRNVQRFRASARKRSRA